MELNLSGKVALVTGASYGLGFACAKALSCEGAKVAICSRDSQRIQKAANDISQLSGNEVSGFCADLASPGDVNELLAGVKEKFKQIDILVFSTGHPPSFSFSRTSDEDWNTGIDLILRPAIALTRGVLADMRQRKFGRLIYMGSIYGLEPEVNSVIQSTLRTGLNSFSKCIASESASEGVTANVVCPGFFETPLVIKHAQERAQESSRAVEEVLEEWKAFAPCGHFGDPDDLGALVAFLASEKAKFLNGTSITMDGGAIGQY